MSGKPAIRAFFDEATNTFSYLAADRATRRAAGIDPVLDYDPKSGEVDIRSVEAILAAAAEADLTIEWSLETHAHADHLSGSPYVKAKTGAKIGIGGALIRRMSSENVLWGAPPIHGELLKLGFAVAQSTVAKYMTNRPDPSSQG